MTEYDKRMKDFAERTIKTFEKFNRQLRLHANELTKALRKVVETESIYTDKLPEGKMAEYNEKKKNLTNLLTGLMNMVMLKKRHARTMYLLLSVLPIMMKKCTHTFQDIQV